MKKLIQTSNLHLSISSLIVVPASFIYGFFPEVFFNVKMNSINENTIFKALMGMYLDFATLWLIGILKPNYWKVATIANILFIAGLGFGRTISMIVDGMPSEIFVIGTFGELVLAIFAFSNLRKFDKK